MILTSIRQRILAILETRSTATAPEISQSLQVTGANIRHHLRKLEQEGLVVKTGLQSGRGRGRPRVVYSLAHPAHNLAPLASHLLQTLAENLPPEDLTALLRQLAHMFVGENGESRPHITQKLYSAIHRLNALNYQARWEAHAAAPRVIFGHCPYRTIIHEHPEICQMDAYLLGELLDQQVTQTARLAQNQRGQFYCMFALQKQSTNSG